MITIEDSLRFRLEYEQEKSKNLFEELMEYKNEVEKLAHQLEVAAEFCRQYQIESKALSVENKQLKAQAEADNETNLQLNLEIMTLKAENKKLGDYYMKINDMFWNDEIFEVNHGEGFYTDKFVEMVGDL